MKPKVLLSYGDADSLERYAGALRDVGLDPVPAKSGHFKTLEGIAGLVLAGGTDVEPSLYNETRHPRTQKPDRERDAGEIALISQWLAGDRPLLAICRGMQILNVQQGGTLTQHLDTAERHVKRGGDRGKAVHAVRLVPGTVLGEVAGVAEWQVNSRHHQAVKTPGPGLRVAARDPFDGTIEALERPDKKFVVAVQWHPEDQAGRDAGQRKLFEAFARAVTEGSSEP